MSGSTAFGLYLDGLCLVYLGAIIALFLVVDFGKGLTLTINNKRSCFAEIRNVLSHFFPQTLCFSSGSAIPVGSVGLAVSQSMVLTMMLQMAARFTADFLGQMTAVERVLEYTDLPIEDNIYDGRKCNLQLFIYSFLITTIDISYFPFLLRKCVRWFACFLFPVKQLDKFT